MTFQNRYDTWLENINATLRGYLWTRRPEELFDAMSYSAFSGGKRIRPILTLAVCDMLGGSLEVCLPFACAIELIHTSSLIHDDLPALDDDDLRRGKPSCHIRYGEGIALLAGDALMNLAYEVMSKQCQRRKLYRCAEAMFEIAASAGADGMLGGQAADLLSENKGISEDDLHFIAKNKTAKLIQAAVTAGAVIADADAPALEQLSDAGIRLGMAFQILDDILDVTGDPDKLGKPVNSDIKNNKQTYVSMHGIQKAKDDYNKISEAVRNIFSQFENSGDFMLPLIDQIIKRDF